MADRFEIVRNGAEVLMVFRGDLDFDGAKDSSEQFVEIIGADTVQLTIDINEMTGYTRQARQIWQKTIFPVRQQLSELIFVGHAPALVRMGASAIGLVLGVPMSFVEHRDTDQKKAA